MCSRVLLLQEHYRAILAALGITAAAEFVSRFNIAPGSAVTVVRPRGGGRAPELEAVALRWGLTPAWAQDDEPATRLVNARAETLAGKPSFRDAFRSRRCVIPASGFYEWQVSGRAKQPWLFRRCDESPFGFAGLWESWRAPDGKPVESCAVITSEPNEIMRAIHHRMPVMLAPEQFARWLDPGPADPATLADLLRPAPASSLRAVAVSAHVSNVRHEGPQCLAPAKAAPAQLPLGL